MLLLKEKDIVLCIKGGVSPDGIHWKMIPDPLCVEYSDTQIVPYYDTVLQKYVAAKRSRNYMTTCGR